MRRIFCCFALALGLPLRALGAQEAPALAPGARVRVISPEHARYERVIGTLESLDTATIVVRRENGQTVSVLRQPGTRLDVSAGPGACGSGRRPNCLVIGALGGVVLGVAVVIAAGQVAPIEASTGLA
jgi:hypothetical protein